ncbi:mRNA-decapping enzyme subunit 2 [Batrachochytrium dendrobatidis]
MLYFESLSLHEVLDDLTSRFIVNVPDEELESIQRVCFQIEQAHWFYEDFVREENPRLPSLSLKHFSLMLFRHCPLLHHWADDHEHAFARFMEYKTRVPVCGAIILNHNLTKILLVRGWKSSASWGFPKGKINKDEPEIACAVREVYEEIGFDTSPYIRQNEYVERTMSEQHIRLYIIAGIPESTEFSTKTRKEIGDIRWFDLAQLPGYNSAEYDSGQQHFSAASSTNIDGSPKKLKFYLVTSFVSALRRWVCRFKKAKRMGKERSRAHLKVVQGYDSQSDSENEGTGASNIGFCQPTKKERASGYTNVNRNSKYTEASDPYLAGDIPLVNDQNHPNNSASRSIFQNIPASDYSSQYIISHSDVTFMENALKKMIGINPTQPSSLSTVPTINQATTYASSLPMNHSSIHPHMFQNVPRNEYPVATQSEHHGYAQKTPAFSQMDNQTMMHPNSHSKPIYGSSSDSAKQHNTVPSTYFAELNRPYPSISAENSHVPSDRDSTLHGYSEARRVSQSSAYFEDVADQQEQKNRLLNILHAPGNSTLEFDTPYRKASLTTTSPVTPLFSKYPAPPLKVRQPSLVTESPEASVLPNPSPRMLQSNKKSAASRSKASKHSAINSSNNPGPISTDVRGSNPNTVNLQATVDSDRKQQEVDSAALLKILKRDPAFFSDSQPLQQLQTPHYDRHVLNGSAATNPKVSESDKNTLLQALFKSSTPKPPMTASNLPTVANVNRQDLLSALLGANAKPNFTGDDPSAILSSAIKTVPTVDHRLTQPVLSPVNDNFAPSSVSLQQPHHDHATAANLLSNDHKENNEDLLSLLLKTVSMSSKSSIPINSSTASDTSLAGQFNKCQELTNASLQQPLNLLNMTTPSEPKQMSDFSDNGRNTSAQYVWTQPLNQQSMNLDQQNLASLPSQTNESNIQVNDKQSLLAILTGSASDGQNRASAQLSNIPLNVSSVATASIVSATQQTVYSNNQFNGISLSSNSAAHSSTGAPIFHQHGSQQVRISPNTLSQQSSLLNALLGSSGHTSQNASLSCPLFGLPQSTTQPNQSSNEYFKEYDGGSG